MGAHPRTLIIEDVSDVFHWLSDRVSDVFDNADISSAASFTEAKAFIESRSWDLFLVDLGLPDGDGADLIPLAKQLHPDAHCVVTTIFDDADHLFPALRAGADGYLLKDEEDQVFAQNLSGILSGRPPLSASVATQMLHVFRPEKKHDSAMLSPREEQMLVLISKGYSSREASSSLSISYHTGAGYLKSVYQKLQVNSRAEATVKAMEMGLIGMGKP
ncbi:Transcriptional regulatory protein DegU [Halioglobus japonicus]|nr:Transcriptional regulatory protein DegU [Halioglobus japonicus]